MSVRKAGLTDKHNEVYIKGNIKKNYLTTEVQKENKKDSPAVKFTLYACIAQTHEHKTATGLRSWNNIDVGRRSLLINVTVNAYPSSDVSTQESVGNGVFRLYTVRSISGVQSAG
jgi:hypothetical protein